MNKSVDESGDFLNRFNYLLLNIPKSKVIFCPSFLALFYMNGLLADTPYELGAQDMHWNHDGAYTGQISARMLKTTGVTWVIIGHSERRCLFGETDKHVHLKIKKALAYGLQPIMCIGETLRQRESGETYSILQQQLSAGLEDISAEEMSTMTIAYEPVWAINTGKRADNSQITEAHAAVQAQLLSMGAIDVPVLYGGSVNSNNVDELLSISEVDGFLIGGASLDPEEFVAIIHLTERYIKEH